MNHRTILFILVGILIPLTAGGVVAVMYVVIRAGQFDLGAAVMGALGGVFALPAVVASQIAACCGVRRRNQLFVFAILTFVISMYFFVVLSGSGEEAGIDFVSHIFSFFLVASGISFIYLWIVASWFLSLPKTQTVKLGKVEAEEF